MEEIYILYIQLSRAYFSVAEPPPPQKKNLSLNFQWVVPSWELTFPFPKVGYVSYLLSSQLISS